MIVLGVAEDRVAEAELEKLAQNAAGRRVNIVPGPFDATPGRLVREMTSSNLAIMPSFHEGFGLVGWEAIGCEVPLILGRETGLFKFIEGLLGGPGIGCLRPQRIRGGSPEERDEEAMSEAIIDVAKDLDRARRDAATLRSQLQIEKGCSWRHTANSLLDEISRLGMSVPAAPVPEPANLGVRSTGKIAPPTFTARSADHFRECSELELSAGQGSSSDRFDVVAELRFGTTPLRVDDMNVDIFVRRASLRVTSEGGKLRGERFGEGRQRVPGVQAMAGGVWVLSDPEGGDMLSGKILGDEVLCRIEASVDVPGAARAEVTVAQADLGCDISLPDGQELAVATRKVMEVFLKKAIFKESSGHVILSEAELHGAEAYA